MSAQYPAGSLFQRGDDPRWADPNFDDRRWVKQSEYRANSYDDYLQNRSWLRARVTIPAGEPTVIVSQHYACEFYVNGLRVAAIGDLNQPRRISIFPLPTAIPPGEAVFAVRRYDPPGLENVDYTWVRSSVPPTSNPGTVFCAKPRTFRPFCGSCAIRAASSCVFTVPLS